MTRWSTLHQRHRRRLRNEQRFRLRIIKGLVLQLAYPIADKVTIEGIIIGYVKDDWIRNCATLRIKTSYITPAGPFYCILPVSEELAGENFEYLKAACIDRVRVMIASFIVNQRLDKGINRYMRVLRRMSTKSLRRMVDEQRKH